MKSKMKYCVFIIAIVLISCKPLHSNIKKNKSDLKTQKNEPQIVFYFFKAVQNNDREVTIELIEKKIVEGTLKGIFSEKISENKLINDYWLVTFLDLSKQNNVQLQLKNPLVEYVEFVNEENDFERKKINHKSKEFVVRLSYKGSIKKIIFEKISKKNQKITKTQLQNIKI